MKGSCLRVKEFNERLEKIDRFWDDVSRTGLSRSQVKACSYLDMGDFKYIHVRGDGWAIACREEGLISCQNLWKEDWREIICRVDLPDHDGMYKEGLKLYSVKATVGAYVEFIVYAKDSDDALEKVRDNPDQYRKQAKIIQLDYVNEGEMFNSSETLKPG